MASNEAVSSARSQSVDILSDQFSSEVPSSRPNRGEKGLDAVQASSLKETTTESTVFLNEERAATNSKPSHESWAVRFFTNGWGAEVLGWIVSAVSVIAILAILAAFNHRSLPQWPYQITLNTLISIFSQISSTALAGPLSQCISQLKWLWFTRRSQHLSDFQDFDDASHGPWPSLLLIWKTRASHLVSLGAFLIIANLAFQPFVQQSVSYPQRLVPSGIGTISTIHNVTIDGLQGNNEINLLSVGSVPPTTVAAIYDGLTGGLNLSDVAPRCSTGNCTWDLYDSIAICANPVANLTHLLNRIDLNSDSDCSIWGTGSGHLCNYTLPNGVYLTGEDMYINITSIGFNSYSPTAIPSSIYPGNQTLASIAFTDIPLILDFFMIYYSPSINNVAAIEGSLSFCGQTYNTSVNHGETNTTEVQRWGQLNTTHAYDYPAMWPIVGNNTTLWVAEGYSDSIQSTLTGIFEGYYFVNDDGNEDYSSVTVEALQDSLVNSTDDIASISLLLDQVAISITNNLRTGTGSIPVQGVELSVETYVLAVWAWLALPIGSVLLTLVFLLGTIWKNSERQSKTWKSSSLATMSALSGETQAHLGPLTSMSTIEERAKVMKVWMVKERDEWKLVTE